MAENRVVIKINYDKNKHRKALIDPKMVTVWHTQRILAAIAILVLVVITIVFWLSTEDTADNIQQAAEIVDSSVPMPVAAIKPDLNIPAVTESASAKPSPISKRPAAIILDKRVIRAALTEEPRSGEPGNAIKQPIILETDQSLELFYFSEIKNMKDQVLFHRWLKTGEQVYKKKFLVKEKKSKLISSKKISAKDTGEWQVTLIDNDGKVYSEFNFSVNP